jgi:hypothetical protein
VFVYLFFGLFIYFFFDCFKVWFKNRRAKWRKKEKNHIEPFRSGFGHIVQPFDMYAAAAVAYNTSQHHIGTWQHSASSGTTPPATNDSANSNHNNSKLNSPSSSSSSSSINNNPTNSSSTNSSSSSGGGASKLNSNTSWVNQNSGMLSPNSMFLGNSGGGQGQTNESILISNSAHIKSESSNNEASFSQLSVSAASVFGCLNFWIV